MTRVLLTGASGFIAAHVLSSLLERGHSVVTTVRTQEKVQKIKAAYPGVGKDKLDFVIVEDISKLDAFDKAVISDPPFETVIHTASPFHFNVKDPQKDFLDPAINGTVGILRAIKASAPSVKRVVITSSFAAIHRNNVPGAAAPQGYVYTEADWNPVTREQAISNPLLTYQGSKTFAERAAWDFVEKEKPNFTIATINPPVVYGPVTNSPNSLDTLNTSSFFFRDLITGKAKDACPPNPKNIVLFVDVRDVGLSHVLAAEKPEAANQRFFITAGLFTYKQIAEAVYENFPEFRDILPTGDALKSGDVPFPYNYDNSKSKKELGLTYHSFTETVVDTVKSLKPYL